MELATLQELVVRKGSCAKARRDIPPLGWEEREILSHFQAIHDELVQTTLKLGILLREVEEGRVLDSRRMRKLLRNNLMTTLRWQAAAGVSSDAVQALVIQNLNKERKILN